MDRVTRFETTYRLGLASVAAVGVELLDDFFANAFPNPGVAASITIGVVLLGVLLLNSLLSSLVESSAWLRRRIMGPDHIEGWWFDVSRDPATGLPHHGMLLEVRRREGAYHSTGVSFDREGRHLATTTSRDSVYANRVLRYRYTSTYAQGERRRDQGYVEIRFDCPAVSYTGVYHEIDDTHGFPMGGQRVSREEVRKHGRFRTLEDKQAFLAEVIETASG